MIAMKKTLAFLFLFFVALAVARAQEIQTVFGRGRSTGGNVAFSNKFTTIGGDFANLSEVYGGAFINKQLMVGFGVAGSTNNIRVPQQYSVSPMQPMTYQYGQGGMMLEYVIGSNRAAHLVFNMFGGVGFTAQYDRYTWHMDNYQLDGHDENWFYVLEPGAQLEMNLFRWLRLSPGVSYRNTYGSNALGLDDVDLSNWSYNITLKIGSFGRRHDRRHWRSHEQSPVEEN